MFVELGGARHHYADREGDGPAVVLLHGLGGSLDAWQGVVAHLAPLGRRLVSLDLRGHGRSAPASPEVSVEGWADDVAALLERLELGGVTLVGHSLSTLVAQHLAVTRPALVDRLVLVGALPGGADPASVRERAAVVREEGMDAVVDGWLSRALTPATQQRLPQLAGLARGLFLRNDPESYANAMTALGEVPAIDHGRIHQPTLLLVGEEDQGTPPSLARALADALAADAEVRELPEAAHWVMLERPEEVAAAIRGHLS